MLTKLDMLVRNGVEIIFDYWSNVLLLFKHTGHTEWVVIE